MVAAPAVTNRMNRDTKLMNTSRPSSEPNTAQLGGLVDGPGTLLVSGTADANGLTTQGNPTVRDSNLIAEDGDGNR